MVKKESQSAPAAGRLVAGLDLGSTKACCLLCELSAEGGLHVVGVGSAPCGGLKKGAVIHIEATVESVRAAVGEAERMAGVKIGSAFVSVGGDHIKGMTSHGVIAVGRKDREVTQEDVARVLEAAKAIAIPQDREILHVLTQEFMIDSTDGIRDPEGMSGVRLEAKVHVVTAAVTSVQNILKSCQRAGLGVDDLVLQPLASAEAVLTPDERELGVLLVDLGGGTTDLVVLLEGAVRHTSVLPVGGAQFTRDLAIGLRTPHDEAEAVKRRLGSARAQDLSEAEEMAIAGVGGREHRLISKRQVAEILQPRAEEVLGLAAAELRKSGFEGKLAAGAVLTGGSSLIQGLAPLAEDILLCPVRLGRPKPLLGLGDVVQSPEYATAVGLVLWAGSLRQQGRAWAGAPAAAVSVGSSLLEKIKMILKEYF